jgi:hypothetical protein
MFSLKMIERFGTDKDYEAKAGKIDMCSCGHKKTDHRNSNFGHRFCLRWNCRCKKFEAKEIRTTNNERTV